MKEKQSASLFNQSLVRFKAAQHAHGILRMRRVSFCNHTHGDMSGSVLKCGTSQTSESGIQQLVKHHEEDSGNGTHHSNPFKGENGRSKEKRESAHRRRQGDLPGVSEILQTKRQRKLEIITE